MSVLADGTADEPHTWDRRIIAARVICIRWRSSGGAVAAAAAAAAVAVAVAAAAQRAAFDPRGASV